MKEYEKVTIEYGAEEDRLHVILENGRTGFHSEVHISGDGVGKNKEEWFDSILRTQWKIWTGRPIKDWYGENDRETKNKVRRIMTAIVIG